MMQSLTAAERDLIRKRAIHALNVVLNRHTDHLSGVRVVDPTPPRKDGR